MLKIWDLAAGGSERGIWKTVRTPVKFLAMPLYLLTELLCTKRRQPCFSQKSPLPPPFLDCEEIVAEGDCVRRRKTYPNAD